MKNESYTIRTEEIREVGESEPVGIMIKSIDGVVPNDVYGFVVRIRGDNEYVVQTPDNENIVVEIPEPLDYSLGDEVLHKHVVDYICLSCGQEMFYNEKKEEYYCPVHD
jgi:predicted RNA-binding Zn-ribbon protein involved in translation (DUF1610 family)